VKHIQDWLLFGIQLIVKSGLLGDYKMVSVDILEQTKANKSGLKTLEKTILSLGKKNDTLNETITLAKYEIATFEKDILELQGKLESAEIKNADDEKRISDAFVELVDIQQENVSLKKDIEDWIVRDSKWAELIQNEKVSFQEKITSLNSTLEQATILSEKLQGEMKKWRT